jgi:peptidoglycan/LPS O-acetylase OafA/YrhL
MWAIMILRVFTYQSSLFNKVWRNSTLTSVGLISYGVYMYHEVVNGLVHGLLFSQAPLMNTPEQLLAGIGVAAITLGLATISYIYLELPIRRYGAAVAKRLSRDREAPKSLAHVAAE